MSGQRPLQPGDLVATRAPDHDNAPVPHAAFVGLRAAWPLADADLTNVIPFARGRRALPALTIAQDDRPAPPPQRTRRFHWIALAIASILLHSSLLLMLWQTPTPLASIGVEAITMEEVLGADTPAGVAATPSDNEVQASMPVEAVKEDTVVEQQEVKAAEQRQVTPEEVQQQEVVEQREIQPQPTRQQVAAERRELRPLETRPQQMVAELREVALEEMPPDTPDEVLTEIPVTVEAEREQPDEVKPVARPKPVQTRAKTQTKAAASPSMPSAPSSGVGRGRSDASSNYAGIVVAHLARHKQYPAAARSNGAQGTGAVTFSIDGSGRVTSATIARGTGSAVLDQELTAMVRRASPFPAPPDGQGRSFTAPVSFRIK